MKTETVSAAEVAAKEAQGWTRTGIETRIAGRLMTVEMQHDGDALAWIDERLQVIATARQALSPKQRRIAGQRDVLRHRGMDV